jgi:nitrous oxide reductase accessory protein NosL
MGPELVPHRTLDAAEDFMRDHEGLGILRFDEVSEAVLLEMQ